MGNILQNRILMSQKEQSAIFNSAEGLVLPVTPDIGGFNVGFQWRPANITQNHALFNWESTFDRNGISLRQNSDGTLAVVGSNASATVFVLTSGSIEVARLWIWVILTYNSSKQVKVFRNNSQLLSGSGTITSNVTSPAIGKRSFAASMFAQGLFKNITFQNTPTAWTQAQIDELVKRNVVPSGATQWGTNGKFTDKSGLNPMSTVGKPGFSPVIP